MDSSYLQSSIITYIGNKRRLLKKIHSFVLKVKNCLGKSSLKSADFFSGSGVVARLLKEHSELLVVNDLEIYADILNRCYLANSNQLDLDWIKDQINFINKNILSSEFLYKGLIYNFYSPRDYFGETSTNHRFFYTSRNALFIDSTRKYIDSISNSFKDYKYFILAPLIVKASINVNTGGVFKSFYKREGKGFFGGKNADALNRIKKDILLDEPKFSENQSCQIDYYCEDINSILPYIKEKHSLLDLVYIDPPYNQHPYGSNYFMLNIIIKNYIDSHLSFHSGIPKTWKRSSFYKKKEQQDALEYLMQKIHTKYMILSYAEGGFMSYEDLVVLLEKYFIIEIIETIKYPIFRASRLSENRDRTLLKEYLFLLKKKKSLF